MSAETGLRDLVKTRYGRTDAILLRREQYSPDTRWGDFYTIQLSTLDDNVLCRISYSKDETGYHLYYSVIPDLAFWEAPPTEESMNGILSLVFSALDRRLSNA